MLAAVLIAAATDVADAAGSSSLPELPSPVQYGLLGTLVFLLASGKFLVPRYVLDRERERADRMEKENVRLNALIADKAIPAIVDASSAVRDSTLLVHDMKHEREIQREINNRRGASDG